MPDLKSDFISYFNRAGVKRLAAGLVLLAASVGAAAVYGSAAPRAYAGTGGTTAAQNRLRSQKPTPSAHLDVIFTSDVPETDIYLQGEKIGPTGKDGQLLVRLVPGDYVVEARKKGYVSQGRTVKVSARQTSFKFYMGAPIPAATPTPTPSPTPAPASSDGGEGGAGDGASAANAAAADDILKRFQDPQQTGKLTRTDWQSLLAATYKELSADPNDTQLKAREQFVQGQLEYLAGNYANAQQAFNTALRLAPEHALAAYGLGNTYLATNQAAQAVKEFERALRADPKMGMAYKGLGEAWTALKKDKEARAAYAQARELGFLSPDVSMNLVRGLVKDKRWAEAVAALQPLAAAQPSAEIYTLLGDAYTGEGQKLNAFEAYRNAVKADDSAARAHYRIGEIQLDEKNYEAAHAAFERALALDTQGLSIDRKKARQKADEAADKLSKLRKSLPKPGVP
ncbi:MAG TPA: tetratricopeptide repeat protein [Pyrinomonadaceae bacterium]|jgi:tetratricopeptide (TPR) repeat protein